MTPTIFTSVYHVKEWIEKVIKDNDTTTTSDPSDPSDYSYISDDNYNSDYSYNSEENN